LLSFKPEKGSYAKARHQARPQTCQQEACDGVFVRNDSN